MKSPKQMKKSLSKKLLKTSSHRSVVETTTARIPVFELPRSHSLCEIPEDAEIHRGFCVSLSEEPSHCERRKFVGLMELTNLNRKYLKHRTAATSVGFRSFSCRSVSSE